MLKIPFSFTADELSQVIQMDVRQGGWGIFFSGIFLISLGVLVVAVIDWRKRYPVVFQISLGIITLETILIVVVPGMWWARYNMLLFYFPVVSMVYLFSKANQYPSNAVKSAAVAGFIGTSLFFNCIPNLMTLDMVMKQAENTRNQLETLKSVTEQSDIKIGVYADFYGRLFTLYDNGVTDDQITGYTYYVDDPSAYQYQLFDGYCLYYSPVSEGVRTSE